jgi:hypothetical protein
LQEFDKKNVSYNENWRIYENLCLRIRKTWIQRERTQKGPWLLREYSKRLKHIIWTLVNALAKIKKL